MSTEPIALWLAGELKSAVQEYPQINEYEPGGYCRQEDQLMDAAADELRRLYELNTELLAELKYIADANPKDWYEEMRDQFQQWAQSRARAAIAKATGGEA